MTPLPLSIDDLPNEILLQVLAPLPLYQLVPLAAVSYRFHALTTRILDLRLAHAASLRGRELLLEAFHPATRLSEPPLHCTCLGTPGLKGSDPEAVDQPWLHMSGTSFKGDKDEAAEEYSDPVQHFREINSMYTHFRPHRRQPSRTASRQQARPRHPAGDIPGSRTHPDTIVTEDNGYSPSAAARAGTYTSIQATAGPRGVNPSSGISSQPDASTPLVEAEIDATVHATSSTTWRQTIVDPEEQAARASFSEYLPPYTLVKQSINLDAAELFGQIRAITKLVAPGPGRGFYWAVTTVSDGVLRLWRDWLSSASLCEDDSIQAPPISSSPDKARKCESAVETHERVVWVNDGPQNVGVKLRVRERQWSRGLSSLPVFVGTNEDMPVSYEIEYEEVLVRTRWLLQVSEQIWEEKQANMANSAEGASRAVVMGMFR